MKKVKCIVLAGGLGSRLSSVLKGLPKCLAPIGKFPFLYWQLKSLAKMGINHFILSLGYKSEMVVHSLKPLMTKKFSIEVVIEPTLLDTGGAIAYAMKRTSLDECLVVNGDTFLSGEVNGITKPLDLNNNEFIRIGITHVNDRTRFGGVNINHAKKVISFIEKGSSSAGYINTGLYKINASIFHGMSNKRFSLEHDVLPQLAVKNKINAYVFEGKFIDIGIPTEYQYFSDNHKLFFD